MYIILWVCIYIYIHTPKPQLPMVFLWSSFLWISQLRLMTPEGPPTVASSQLRTYQPGASGEWQTPGIDMEDRVMDYVGLYGL